VHDPQETIWHLAKLTTGHAFHTLRFRVSEVFVLASLGIFVALWQPSWAESGKALATYQVILPLAGAAGAALAIFLAAVALAPYRQRNQGRIALARCSESKAAALETLEQRLAELTTPRIETSLERTVGADRQMWIRLRVHNPTSVPITSCYGHVRLMRSLHTEGGYNGSRDDQPFSVSLDGHEFPWQEHGGPTERHRILPTRSTDYLDIAMRRQVGESFALAGIQVVGGTGQLFPSWPVRMFGPLLYELIVQIGSTSTTMQPSFVRLVVKPDEDQVELEELSEDAATGYINRP
jgi:hypothetical protein